jgi:hypothetical protein
MKATDRRMKLATLAGPTLTIACPTSTSGPVAVRPPAHIHVTSDIPIDTCDVTVQVVYDDGTAAVDCTPISYIGSTEIQAEMPAGTDLSHGNPQIVATVTCDGGTPSSTSQSIKPAVGPSIGCDDLRL